MSTRKKGSDLTQLFNELKTLYFRVKSSNSDDLSSEEGELKRILDSYYGICIYKQILFSDWYAHYKFFWQNQIDWINEQKQFKFWRDKVPLSLTVFISILLAGGVAVIVCACLGVI
ncbi:SLATT domain-containing protein [Oligosphaera ethanolica]|uniref:SLATT domain-containing protein n=1 Tax=Oligosphaera ethanolica TaxID=760260 RepID=UPI003521AEF9